MGQKEPPRLGSTICYGQELARKSNQDSAVRFVMAKSWPERAAATRQYDVLRPNVGQKELPRLGSTICYGQTWARKSHRDSARRFVTPNVGQQEPPRLGSPICYGQELARKSHQDSAVRFVMAKRGSERATKTRQYDLLQPRVGQKEPPRLGSTICYGQEFGQKEPQRLGSTICYGQELSRKSNRDSAVRFVTAKSSAIRFVTAKSWPERAAKTRQYDLLRPNVGQIEPPRLGSTICYGQELARKSHQDSAVRFVTAKIWPERATKTRQYDLLRPRVESHQHSAVRFVTANRGPERATKTRQYDLLRPNMGQKEPPRLGSTICYSQELARKSH